MSEREEKLPAPTETPEERAERYARAMLHCASWSSFFSIQDALVLARAVIASDEAEEAGDD